MRQLRVLLAPFADVVGSRRILGVVHSDVFQDPSSVAALRYCADTNIELEEASVPGTDGLCVTIHRQPAGKIVRSRECFRFVKQPILAFNMTFLFFLWHGRISAKGIAFTAEEKNTVEAPVLTEVRQSFFLYIVFSAGFIDLFNAFPFPSG